MQGDKELKVSHAPVCGNASLPSVDKASRLTSQSKFVLIYNFLLVFSWGRFFPAHQQA